MHIDPGFFGVSSGNVKLAIKLPVKSWLLGDSLIYVCFFAAYEFDWDSRQTAPQAPHRAAPGLTAAAMANYGASGPRPHGGDGGALRCRRPQAPRWRRWPIAAPQRLRWPVAVRAAPPLPGPADSSRPQASHNCYMTGVISSKIKFVFAIAVLFTGQMMYITSRWKFVQIWCAGAAPPHIGRLNMGIWHRIEFPM